MMTRIKSTKVAKLKILLMLPMVAFMVYAFAEPVHKATDLTEVALPTDDTTVFWVVEQKPEYIGGMKALVKHIASNTIYPEQAKEEGIQGKVYVKFVVEKDGSVRRAEVARGVHPLLDSEALRVVNSMPIWIPGMQRGKKVAVWFVVPINFTLKDTPKTNCKE